MNKPTLIQNSPILTELKQSLILKFNQEREGIHVSDINLCLRETVFRRIDPKELKDRDLNVFTSGRAIHDAIQILAEHHEKYEKEKEISYEIDGITIKAHIDLYNKEKNIPIEIKSVRSNRVGYPSNPNEPKAFNVEQLKMYMTLCNSEVGYIIYQLLLDFGESPFKVFEVKMDKQERQKMLEKMLSDAFHLQMNLDLKTPENTRHIFGDKDKGWKCSYCKYSKECQSMRNQEYIKTRKD